MYFIKEILDENDKIKLGGTKSDFRVVTRAQLIKLAFEELVLGFSLNDDGVSIREWNPKSELIKLRIAHPEFKIKLIGVRIVLDEYSGKDEVVDIPYGVNMISPDVFSDKLFIKEVIIPESVVCICMRAFQGCGITSLHLPDSVKIVEERAFQDCESLENVELSHRMRQIPEFCFSYCFKLTKVIGTENIEDIYSYAFSRCFRLKSIEEMPKLMSIGNKAFNECESLEKFEFYSSLTSVGDCAFYGIQNMKPVFVRVSESKQAKMLLDSIPCDMLKNAEFKGCYDDFINLVIKKRGQNNDEQ